MMTALASGGFTPTGAMVESGMALDAIPSRQLGNNFGRFGV